MKNKDNAPEKKNDSGELGTEKQKNKLSNKPAPKGTDPDRESETTPPGNEVYVDLEPDELHLADEDEVEDVSDLRDKNKDDKKKKK